MEAFLWLINSNRYPAGQKSRPLSIKKGVKGNGKKRWVQIKMNELKNKQSLKL
jgi:hypothetical protein